MFPKSLGGLIGLAVTAVLTVSIGLFIINRVGFLSRIVYGKAA